MAKHRYDIEGYCVNCGKTESDCAECKPDPSGETQRAARIASEQRQEERSFTDYAYGDYFEGWCSRPGE